MWSRRLGKQLWALSTPTPPFFAEQEVSREAYLFGYARNVFDYAFAAESAKQKASAKKKPGKREVVIKRLGAEEQEQFVGRGGARAKEWKAWQDFAAVEVLGEAESRRVRETKRNLIVPMRWIDTDKADGKLDEDGKPRPLEAKSRLVVIGFRDQSLGFYRRDAPTASRLAEGVLLALAAGMGMTLELGDVKNAYFNGKQLDREVYLEQPAGGLPELKQGQLLRACKAIYGFAEAARHFWIALSGAMAKAGWKRSLLEDAFFTLRRGGQLVAMAVTHVDDLLLARSTGHRREDVLGSVATDFEWKWSSGKFVFRGREIEEHSDGFRVYMRDYASALKGVVIARDRRKLLEEQLTVEEKAEWQRSTGEIGWIARQGRLDLAHIAGSLQRAGGSPCIADLIKCNVAVAEAKRGQDVGMRYPRSLRVSSLCVGCAVDAGHANGEGAPEAIETYRSCGGYVLLLADEAILQDKSVPVAILDWKSGMTQRVCRSTLAAEAAHLANAVEIVDWTAVFLRETLQTYVDLRHWQVEARAVHRFWATDARSVFDYCTKEGTSMSKDKRMAIEGALLREVLREPRTTLRWIDGSQNIADVLTKLGVDKTYLYKVQREAKWSLVQDPVAAAAKAQKAAKRTVRREVLEKQRDARYSAAREQRAGELMASGVCDQAAGQPTAV